MHALLAVADTGHRMAVYVMDHASHDGEKHVWVGTLTAHGAIGLVLTDTDDYIIIPEENEPFADPVRHLFKVFIPWSSVAYVTGV